MKGFAVALFILITLVWLTASVPARVVMPSDVFLTKARQLILRDSRGTLWNGEAQISAVSSNSRYKLNWSINPTCLASLNICVDAEFRPLGHSDQASELFFKLKIPLVKGILAHESCTPLGRLELSEISGQVDIDLLSLFVSQIHSQQNPFTLRQLGMSADLAEGKVQDLDGSIVWKGGEIVYRGPQNKLHTARLPRLEGLTRKEAGEYFLEVFHQEELALKVHTTNEQRDVTMALYDTLAREFGLGPIGSASNQATPRLEVSQPIKDIICSSDSSSEA